MRKQTPCHPSTSGFTLLELLLVVIVLSTVAYMMMSGVENDVSQVRYEDTRNRLDRIRTAVLGPEAGSKLWANGVLTGYVVDNGVLPENIRELVENPDYDLDALGAPDFDEFGALVPIFDSTPTGGYNDGVDEITLSDHPLMKGHRGAYLMGAINQEFRDGWGTQGSADGTGAIDCPTDPGLAGGTEGNDEGDDNFGWCVTQDVNGSYLYVDSYGMDGVAGATSGTDYEAYEQDMVMNPPVLSDDWQVTIPAGPRVTIRNSRTTDLDLSDLNGGGPGAPSTNLRASLLIHENTISGGRWRRLTSTPIINSNVIIASGELTVEFAPAVKVPAGEHLLVLVSDFNGTEETVDDTPEFTSVTGWPGSEGYITAHVKFYPRGGVPEMVLEIR